MFSRAPMIIRPWTTVTTVLSQTITKSLLKDTGIENNLSYRLFSSNYRFINNHSLKISTCEITRLLNRPRSNSIILLNTHKTCDSRLRMTSGFRFYSTGGNWENPNMKKRNKSVLIYICAVGVLMVGGAYAGVPLYRIFCQATGLGGQPTLGHDVDKVEDMKSNKNRLIQVQFNADTASSLKWNFKPQQTEVRVHPGETALAFYKAKNPTDKPVVGISTYNVVPFEAGQYFNKIQCFCFEEQRLNPNEEVDMPVFFYIDPEFAEDPKLQHVDRIILSYTFFEAKEGMDISKLPGYLNEVAQKSAAAVVQ